MNKERRRALDGLLSVLETKRDELRSLCDEEQEAFDNLPESLQAGERGQAMETGIEAIEDAIDQLEEVCGLIRPLIGA